MEPQEFYHSLQRFGVRPGLDSITRLMEKLGNVQNELKFVHVAGTNGKGTVCHFLESVLTAAGFQVGLYTSPYILDFRERIQVSGEMIPPDALEYVTQQVSAAVEALAAEGVVVTEFEAVTAAAFLWFYAQNCDIVILEVGLGGRFDATNVIEEPLVSVLTSISLDHTAVLGDTVEQIAFEKAGIIKPNCDAITYLPQPDGVTDVFRRVAAEKNARLTVVDAARIPTLFEDLTGSGIFADNLLLRVPFPGQHQKRNALLAYRTLKLLESKGFSIPKDAYDRGFAETRNPARCEIIAREPLILLDGCHNPDSARALALVMKKYLGEKHAQAVVGMLADKDTDEVVSILAPYFTKVWCTEPDNPRRLSRHVLAGKFASRGVLAEALPGRQAVRRVLASLSKSDTLIVCGSLYLCADLRPTLFEVCGHK